MTALRTRGRDGRIVDATMIDVDVAGVMRQQRRGPMLRNEGFDQLHDVEQRNRVESIVGEVAEVDGSRTENFAGFLRRRTSRRERSLRPGRARIGRPRGDSVGDEGDVDRLPCCSELCNRAATPENFVVGVGRHNQYGTVHDQFNRLKPLWHTGPWSRLMTSLPSSHSLMSAKTGSSAAK